MKSRYQDIFHQIEKDREQGQGSNKNSHLLIIDGLNTFIRVFSAVPALNDDGMHIGGVTGFLRSIAAVMRQLNRHQEFASLEDEQESMKRQYGRMIQYLHCLPVTTMAIDQIEADDAIAYLTTQVYNKPDNRVTIVSTDRDFLQLVDDRVSVWSPVKKKMYTPDLMRDEFGIDAKNYLLYRAITGDKSDNIPGVNGVGLKTMIKRIPPITEYSELSVDELVDYVSGLDKKYKVHEILEQSGDQIKLNYDLMQLKDVDISGDAKMKIMHIAQDEITKMDVLAFKKMFMVDKMYTVIKDLDTWLTSAFNPLNAYRSL